MSSYISFLNNSSRPAVTVFLDETEVEALLLAHKKSPLHITDAGSHSVIITDSVLNTLFDLYIPLFPNTINTIIIEDSTAYLADHPL